MNKNLHQSDSKAEDAGQSSPVKNEEEDVDFASKAIID